MTDSTGTTTAATRSGLLTPTSRAVAGLALAVAGLLGQNVISSGLQIVLLGDGGAGGPVAYAMGLGLGAAVPALIALALVSTAARGDGDDWSSHLSRAAMVISVVVLAGAVLTVVAALLRS